MRVVYIDAALSNELGHHANFCRNVVRELRSRRIPVTIYGHISASRSLGEELGVRPLFRLLDYAENGEYDPICGWLTSFEKVAECTFGDLKRIGVLGPGDLLYVNSAMPPQLKAVIQWMGEIPLEKRPKVIVELNMDPGITLQSNGSVEVPDARKDPRPTLYRYTSRLLRPEDQSWLKLLTFDASTSAGYHFLLRYPVEAWPAPHQAITGCHSRVGRQSLTVSVLGHQRVEKGYRLVPEIARRLLEARPNLVFLAHNGAPEQMPEEQRALRKLAETDRRLVLNELTAGPPLWSKLIDASDLIVCPYDPIAFATRVSAVTNEALANAVAVVVPNHTSMAEMLQEFGNPGEAFEHQTSDSIVTAILTVLDDYDRYAGAADAAAKRWENTRGSSHLVDALFAWQPTLARIGSQHKVLKVPQQADLIPA